MNNFFSAVGLKTLNDDSKIEDFIKTIIDAPDDRYILGNNSQDIFVEYYKYCGKNFGVVLRGKMDSDENISEESVSPFSFSNRVITFESIKMIENKKDFIFSGKEKSTYNEFVFQLQNVVDFLDESVKLNNEQNVNLVGLGCSGTVLLPVYNDEATEKYKKENEKIYRELISKANSGDIKSKEMLTTKEKEVSEIIRTRLIKEDFFTVVESMFVQSSESEKVYTILGNILKVDKVKNEKTGEQMYYLTLEVRGSNFEVMINVDNTEGLPMVGMRFLASCWFQGRLVLY